MKAVIIDANAYDGLPSALCDAIWNTLQKPYGAKLISKESGGTIDRITMTGLLHNTIKATLDEVSE